MSCQSSPRIVVISIYTLAVDPIYGVRLCLVTIVLISQLANGLHSKLISI